MGVGIAVIQGFKIMQSGKYGREKLVVSVPWFRGSGCGMRASTECFWDDGSTSISDALRAVFYYL